MKTIMIRGVETPLSDLRQDIAAVKAMKQMDALMFTAHTVEALLDALQA